jgi:hypothetical protein
MDRALRAKRCNRHDTDFDPSLDPVSALERLMLAYVGILAFDRH